MATILIIDDDPGIRETVIEVLGEAGHAVLEAKDGDEGMRLFTEHPIDVVLTDLYMPGKGGTETIQEIRKIRPDTMIIAISGGGVLAPDASLNIAKLRGADHVLAKPIPFDTLKSLVAGIGPGAGGESDDAG